jgi:hypothetical protein
VLVYAAVALLSDLSVLSVFPSFLSELVSKKRDKKEKEGDGYRNEQNLARRNGGMEN